MTAQPIATVLVYTRNGRQALSLPFLKEKYHACCFSFSRLQGVYTRCRGQSIWKDISVVRFLPLSFYAKKKVAERKARIRGGGAKDARIREHMAAPVPPLMYLPL